MSYQPIIEEKEPSPLHVDAQGTWTASRQWSVVALSQADAVLQMQAYGIIQGCAYVNSKGGVPNAALVCLDIGCTTRHAAPANGSGLYGVVANYSTIARSAVSQPGGPAVYNVKRNRTNKAVDSDVYGLPITNYAGEPINPPITKKATEYTLVVDWWVKSNDHLAVWKWLVTFADTVNLNTFKGAEPGCLLFTGPDVLPAVNGWVKCHVELEYKPPFNLPSSRYPGLVYAGWYPVWNDKGRRKRVPVDKDHPLGLAAITIPGDDGRPRPVTEPVPLDLLGHPLDPGAVPYTNGASLYLFSDFALIGI